MNTAPQIPNEYTACEFYAGHTIALRNGLYSAFKAGLAVAGTTSTTRAKVRRLLDTKTN